jgi:hypothetical protein
MKLQIQIGQASLTGSKHEEQQKKFRPGNFEFLESVSLGTTLEWVANVAVCPTLVERKCRE